MNDKRVIAILRTAERGLLAAYRWIPYPDEIDEGFHEELRGAENRLRQSLDVVRAELREVEKRILNVAEHEGAK